MKRNTLFSFLTVAALGLLTAGSAYAGTFTWKTDAGSDAFRTADNWTGSGFRAEVYPSAGDKAIVQATTNGNDPVIDDQDEAFGELDIQSGGLLTITGKTLTLDGTAQHDIAGNLVLSDATAVLKFSASVTVAGAGQIKGEDNAAEIQIATNKVLISTMSTVGIVGNMKIAGPGKLDNRGLVHANASGGGTLALDSNLIVVDRSGNRWKVDTHSDNVLQFAGGIACDNLAGNFNLDGCATLKFNGDVYTSGSFTAGDGFIDVVSASFNYDCDAGCSECTTVNSDTSYGSCG